MTTSTNATEKAYMEESDNLTTAYITGVGWCWVNEEKEIIEVISTEDEF